MKDFIPDNSSKVLKIYLTKDQTTFHIPNEISSRGLKLHQEQTLV